MSILVTIIIVNLFISSLSMSGAILLLNKKYIEKFVLYAISFAAGVMLTAVFINVLPEAIKQGEANTVFIFVLFGMIISFLLERSLLWYHHHHNEDTHGISPSVLLVLIGDSLHNFIDGIAIAAVFITSPALGLTTTIAIAAHEIPQELADFGVLIHCGMKKTKALVLNFLSALTAIIGGIVGFYFIHSFNTAISPILGFTGGIFIYIAAADLIPELHRDHKKSQSFNQTIIFLIGIFFMFAISKIFSE